MNEVRMVVTDLATQLRDKIIENRELLKRLENYPLSHYDGSVLKKLIYCLECKQHIDRLEEEYFKQIILILN